MPLQSADRSESQHSVPTPSQKRNDRDETQRVDTHRFVTLQEAEKQAQEWAGFKRGHMSVVYQRTSGTVRAQYVQFPNGFLAYMRYNAQQVMIEYHNLHLFAEVGDVPETTFGSNVLPLFSSLHPQIVPLPDSEREEGELFAFLHAPVPNKISIDVVANRPLDEPADDETLLTVQIDLTDGTLSVLCWNKERNGQDPHKFVAATLPVCAVTQRLSHYQRDCANKDNVL